MKCFYCGEEIRSEWNEVLVSGDGDFVHEECEKPYNAEKEYFLNSVVQSEKLTTAWLFAGGDTGRIIEF